MTELLAEGPPTCGLCQERRVGLIPGLCWECSHTKAQGHGDRRPLDQYIREESAALNAIARLDASGIHTPSDSRATVPPPQTEPPELAFEQDILARFVEDARRAGVVGEDRLIATEYLAITSRVLDKPVSLVVKGASSSGKSFSTETTCRFFPRKAIVPFTGLSEKALLLSERSYEHRTIVIYEAVALRERAERQSGDQTAYYLRSLVSEGEAHYEMSVRTKDGDWTTRRFEKRGPTNVIVTTTAVALHNENETRMLSLPTNDSPNQTRNVLVALADEAAAAVDLEPWHQLQEWLWHQDNRVVIPFARYIAENIPPVAVRLRRDFGAILSLVKAHAVLHQASRDRDDQGRVIASAADYEAVRGLVLDVVSEGIGATVSPTIRETAAAIMDAATEEVSAAEVGRRLGLDKSAARRRLQAAVSAGYVENREDRRGRPGRYALGEPLPDDLEILPPLPPHHHGPPETARQPGGGTVASVSKGVEAPPDYYGNGVPGFPGVVAMVRGIQAAEPHLDAQAIHERTGYALVTVEAALARIREEG